MEDSLNRLSGFEVPPTKHSKAAAAATETHDDPAPGAAHGAPGGAPPQNATAGPPSQIPKMPVQPHATDTPDLWEDYYAAIVKYVKEQAPRRLLELGIDVGGDICKAPPTKIEENVDNNMQRNSVTTFRGHWDMSACAQSLNTTSLYEECGSAHWFDCTNRTLKVGVKANEQGEKEDLVVDDHIPWSRVQAGCVAFGQDKLAASSEKAGMRRIIFPTTIPSFCNHLKEAQQFTEVKGPGNTGKVKQPRFTGLLPIAGRQHLLGMYYCMAQCLEGWDAPNRQNHFLKIWEAGVKFHIMKHSNGITVLSTHSLMI